MFKLSAGYGWSSFPSLFHVLSVLINSTRPSSRYKYMPSRNGILRVRAVAICQFTESACDLPGSGIMLSLNRMKCISSHWVGRIGSKAKTILQWKKKVYTPVKLRSTRISTTCPSINSISSLILTPIALLKACVNASRSCSSTN